jgi:hypothetical protein
MTLFLALSTAIRRRKTRQKIYSILTAKGYIRKFEEFSGLDDDYVRADQLTKETSSGVLE